MRSIPPVNTPEIQDDWERELPEDELWRRFHRVSGEVVCDVCGRIYYDHPMETRVLSSVDDRPWLHRLCNGWLGHT